MQIPSAKELLEAGVHFGHRVSRGHPRMNPFIYGQRDGVHIIDLTLSEKYLKEACSFVKTLGKNGQTLLLVGTKKQAQSLVQELAKKVKLPYLTNRWIGGFFTNFEQIQNNMKKLKELKEAKEKRELQKYTKKEQLLIDRQIKKLEKDLGGVEDLEKLPEAVFIVDAAREKTAINEAVKKGVKVVAIADSNCDPTMIDYPIPGNDDAIKSIKIIVETVIAAYEEGQKGEGRVVKKEKPASAKATAGKKGEIAIPEEDVAVAEEKVEKLEVKESERKIE